MQVPSLFQRVDKNWNSHLALAQGKITSTQIILIMRSTKANWKCLVGRRRRKVSVTPTSFTSAEKLPVMSGRVFLGRAPASRLMSSNLAIPPIVSQTTFHTETIAKALLGTNQEVDPTRQIWIWWKTYTFRYYLYSRFADNFKACRSFFNWFCYIIKICP